MLSAKHNLTKGISSHCMFTYLQYEEPLSRGAENRVVESPNYGDDCVDECQWFNPNLLIQQPSSIGMNTNISSTGNSNDVEYQPAGGIVNAPSSLGPSQHYPCHSSTMPAATNSWEPPVPLGGQVYQVRNTSNTYFVILILLFIISGF